MLYKGEYRESNANYDEVCGGWSESTVNTRVAHVACTSMLKPAAWFLVRHHWLGSV